MTKGILWGMLLAGPFWALIWPRLWWHVAVYWCVFWIINLLKIILSEDDDDEP